MVQQSLLKIFISIHSTSLTLNKSNSFVLVDLHLLNLFSRVARLALCHGTLHIPSGVCIVFLWELFDKLLEFLFSRPNMKSYYLPCGSKECCLEFYDKM